MNDYESLKETLSFYGVKTNSPYYISSGEPISKFQEKPFRMDFYSFCICTSGNIHLEIDSKEYVITENDFLISAPSTIVRFLEISTDFRMRLLFFEKNFLLKNISNPFVIEKMALFQKGSYSIVQPNLKQAESFLGLLNYLKDKSQLTGKYTEEIIRTIIFNILLEIAEIIHTHNNNEADDIPQKELALKFSQLVRDNIHQHTDVKYYAQQLFVSGKYLLETVKKNTGKTPHRIIDEFLLKEAFVLLGNPERTVSEIAFTLQFNSASAFGRFFKKYTSMSPSAYREKVK